MIDFLVRSIGTVVIAVGVGVLLARAAIREGRAFRAGRRKPLITASDDELDPVEIPWPAREATWPDPKVNSTLSLARLQQYASLARLRKDYFGWFGELGLLVASGVLGFQVPAISKAIGDYSLAWNNLSDSHVQRLTDYGSSYLKWLESLGQVGASAWPIALGAIAIGARWLSRNFSLMERSYLDAADAKTRSSLQSGGAQLNRDVGLAISGLFRRLIRRGSE